MTGKAEALAVYQQVCALAEDYARALDGPMATMAARAWFGGGAQGFADELASRRQRAQQAWAQAMDEAASLVLQRGGPCLQPPAVSSPVGTPALRGALVGAEVSELAAAHVPGPAAHTVMLGHSYGSLVVGRAAVRWPGKLADDLAFVDPRGSAWTGPASSACSPATCSPARPATTRSPTSRPPFH